MHTNDTKMRDDVDPPRYSSESIKSFLDNKFNPLDGSTTPDDDGTVRYMASEDKMIISIDVGNSFSSVTLAHLTWNTAPLSRSSSTTPSFRTVLKYPSSTPTLTPISSRTPSLIYYDHEDRPRAHGAECLLAETKERAKEEGWTLVKGFKEQMRPQTEQPPLVPVSSSKESKRVLKKAKTTPQLMSPPSGSGSIGRIGLRSSAMASTQSLGSTFTYSPFGPRRSITPDGLRDAVDGVKDVKLAEPLSPTRSTSSKESKENDKDKKKKDKTVKVHHGPKLKDIWGDHLKHLIACARCYWGENVPNGEAIFDSLWPTCVFVIPHPADWTSTETDLIREAMEKANLVPRNFSADKLVFVRDSVATTCFVQNHTKEEWLKAGESFVVCDAAELGVSIIGYQAVEVEPRLKLRAYEATTRLPAGSEAIITKFREELDVRLPKSKASSLFVATLINEFGTKVLPSFSGAEDPDTEFKLRLVPEGLLLEGKGAIRAEKMSKVNDGCIPITAEEVEKFFRPIVDSIIVRLSSVIPRGSAKHIVLAGGFGESPYLNRRLRETFEPQGVRIVVPDIPAHIAVSEGALTFYLSEKLRNPRKTRFRLGFEVAVEWHKNDNEETFKRDVFFGSGGNELLQGKFGTLVEAGIVPRAGEPFCKPYHMRYRLCTEEAPIVTLLLWAQDPNNAARDWITDEDGNINKGYRPACVVSADLASLVAISQVHGRDKEAFVCLDIYLVVFVGESSLEAMVAWREKGELRQGESSRIADEFF